MSGLTPGGDDAPAQGLFLLDDLVDLVGGTCGAVPGTRTTPVGVGDGVVAGLTTTPPTATGDPTRPGRRDEFDCRLLVHDLVGPAVDFQLRRSAL
jgi:hypothetical protein